MSVADIERAALSLPEDELIDLVDRLYLQANRPTDPATATRVRLADARELASKLDPEGDSPFDEFVADLKASR